MANTIGSLFVKLGADTSDFDRGMASATGTANKFSGVAGRVGDAIKGFLIYDVGKTLVQGFGNAIKAGIDYNATLEQSAIKWETLLGSQDKASKMLKEIEQFAKTTPFEKMGVEAMATQLHNAGFTGQALFDQLTKFGDLGGAFGVQQASLEEMVRQYAQVKQAGVAYTEDLNILQDRGIPIYKALAEELGINTADVKKWASDGKISAEVYQSALDNLAKGVEGGMNKMSKSFSGQLSTLKDNFLGMAGVLSQPIFEFLSKQLEKVMPFIEAVSASLSENGLMGTIQKFAPQAMPFIQAIIGIFDTLKANVKKIIDSIMGFWEEHKGWLMPLIMFVWNFVANFISNTINAIGNVVESGLAVIDGIINFFQNLFKGNFQGAWESVKQMFSNGVKFAWNLMQVNFAFNIPQMIKNFGKNFKLWIDDAWVAVKNFFKNGSSNVLNSAKSGFNSVLNAIKQYMQQVPSTIKNFMTQAVNTIKSINLFSIGKNLIQGLINGIKNMGKNVAGAIGNVVNSAVSSAKKMLGINSPSRVFMEFGEYTSEGLAIGIDKKNKDVVKASQRLSSGVMNGYNANIKTNFSNGSNGANNGKSVIFNIDKMNLLDKGDERMNLAQLNFMASV